MSKAILVMDMPSNCYECPCCHIDKDYDTCEANYIILLMGHDKKRPEWCPLREVPQKREQYGARDGIAVGYNQCIDEILGGAE
jgi:hypothetical protein